MVRAYAKRSVNIPHDKVWKLLSDLESLPKYHPTVKSVEITSASKKGIGATRLIQYVDGSRESEEVVQVGQGYIIFKQKALSGPDVHFTITYTVKQSFETWTEIVLEANYTVKVKGPLGLLSYLLHFTHKEKRLQRQFQKILEGIEYHLTTRNRVHKCIFSTKMPRTCHHTVGAMP